MNNERIKNTCYILVLALCVLVIGYLSMRYVLPLLLPFLIAFFVGLAVKKPAAFLSEKTKLPEKGWSLLLTVSVISGLLVLMGFGVYRLSIEVWHFLEGLGEEPPTLEGTGGIFGREGIVGGLISGFGEEVAEGIYSLLIKLLGSLGSFLSGVIASVPRVALGSLITLIASIYFALDIGKITGALLNILPERIREGAVKVSHRLLDVGIKYARSYLILMLITFLIILAGFLILRVPYAVLLSMGVSVLDVLPVIGVGTVLIPWSVVELIRGNIALSVGLLVLYLVNLVIRQLVEPRIVGKHLGVHPVLTLFLLYVGYSLFGIAGLLLVPLATVVVKSIKKEESSNIGEGASAE